MIRVVLDTSVLISALLSATGAPAGILRRWRDGSFDVIVCPLLLDELRSALQRPALEARVDADEAEAFIAAISRAAVHHPDPATITPVIRAPNDDYLIALAREAGANALISVDLDLLDLEAADPVVLSPRAFLDRL